MKSVRRLAIVSAVLLLTCLLTRWWLGTAWSESVWSWLNHWIDAGQNPGLASNVEFVATLAAAFAVSSAVVLLLLRAIRRAGHA